MKKIFIIILIMFNRLGYSAELGVLLDHDLIKYIFTKFDKPKDIIPALLVNKLWLKQGTQFLNDNCEFLTGEESPTKGTKVKYLNHKDIEALLLKLDLENPKKAESMDHYYRLVKIVKLSSFFRYYSQTYCWSRIIQFSIATNNFDLLNAITLQAKNSHEIDLIKGAIDNVLIFDLKYNESSIEKFHQQTSFINK